MGALDAMYTIRIHYGYSVITILVGSTIEYKRARSSRVLSWTSVRRCVQPECMHGARMHAAAHARAELMHRFMHVHWQLQLYSTALADLEQLPAVPCSCYAYIWPWLQSFGLTCMARARADPGHWHGTPRTSLLRVLLV